MTQSILVHTAELFGLTPDDLTGRSRQRHIAQARQAAAYALWRSTSMSLAAIGAALGGRDHSTVLHSLAAAEQRAHTDPFYARRLRALTTGR